MAAPERPLLHFTPPAGWTNDPNGTLYLDGEYHLFYQHYPDDIVWGPMHWGHAVSPDLLTWEHLPIALAPDELGMCFSGSAVVDEANTSGFGNSEQEGAKPPKPPLVAVYTSHSGEDGAQVQRQSIAYSNDGGRTFRKYAGNPVVSEPAFRDFRDPRCFWHGPTKSWVMVVAAGDRARLYRSANLRQWQFASEFGPVPALGDAVWECPDLFPLPWGDGEKWVFSLSVTSGGPTGGNGVKYFVGSFDGTRYTAETAPRLADHGLDFYAPITFTGTPGRTVWIGWLNSWAYSTATPAEGWRGMMSLPRELSLAESPDGPILVQQTCAELDKHPRATAYGTGGEGAQAVRQFDCDIGHAAVLQGELAGLGQLTLTLFGSLRLTVDTAAMTAAVERPADRNSCAHPLFAQPLTAPLLPGVPVTVRVIVDANAVEFYLQDGKVVLSALTYPREHDHGAHGELAGDGRLEYFIINRLK